MHLTSTLICRSSRKIYELIRISDIVDGITIVPLPITSATAKGVPAVPLRLIEVSRSDSSIDMVAVYPDLAEVGKAEYSIGAYNADERLVDSVSVPVNFRQAKWASRLNYRFRSGKCRQIRHIDEHTPPHGGLELKITSDIPDGNHSILRGEIKSMNYPLAKLRLSCIDAHLSILSEQYTAMGATFTPESDDGSPAEHSVSFSIRIKRTDEDLFLVAWDESSPSHIAHLHFPLQEQKRLEAPYNFYLYENADVSPYYDGWLKTQRASEYVLGQQRLSAKIDAPDTAFELFVVADSQDKMDELALTISSLNAQSYPNWSLFVAHPSNLEVPIWEDNRVFRISLDSSSAAYEIDKLMRSNASNRRYLMVLHPGDQLEPDALFHCWKLASSSTADAIYCDEDSYCPEGKHFHPIFKPELNKELLLSEDYLSGALFIGLPYHVPSDLMRCSSLSEWLYGISLDLSERANQIVHTSRVLVHHIDRSESSSAPILLPSYPSVVCSHLERSGVAATVDSQNCHTRVTYQMPPEQPLVSIIIPSKDHADLLNTCITSIIEKTTYQNYEIIVVENNSTDSETFTYYDELESRYGDIVRVARWPHEFNFSKIINFGRKHAGGSYLLLLNNDTELLTPNWLEILVGIVSREGIGAAGVKLFYPDDTIQHAGVSISKATCHQFCELPKGQPSYLSYVDVQREVSCVTAACLITKAEVFDQVGGFDPTFTVAFNDVNFCMTLRSMGYSIIYTPYVELYHYESISRGRDDDPRSLARQVRSSVEWSELMMRWADRIIAGDPFTSPNVRDGNPDCQYFLVKEYFDEQIRW